MSQGFNFKYNQMKENSPGQNKAPENNDIGDSNSNVKNVCFALADGRMQFFNYGYLIKATYLTAKNTIILSFTSDIVTLEGIELEKLFFDFMHHSPRYLKCTDSRYNALDEKNAPIINRIDIEENV